MVNAITLAPIEDFHRDPDAFGEGEHQPEPRQRIDTVMQRGYQERQVGLDLPALKVGLSE